MVGQKVKSHMLSYLKSHFIHFYQDVSGDIGRITMSYSGYENCPDKTLESCIYFFTNCMECRVYYTKNASNYCRDSNHQSELMRFLNYINATVWPCGADGIGGTLYKTSQLYAPRIYMTEDGCYDITMTFIVPYDFYEIAPLETADFLTACIPELLDNLSPSIFLLLLGKIKLDDAIRLVKRVVLYEQ